MCFHQTVVSLFPVSGIDKIIPLRYQIVQRTSACHSHDGHTGLAERHTAVHASCALNLLFFHGKWNMKFLKIFDALLRLDRFRIFSLII